MGERAYNMWTKSALLPIKQGNVPLCYVGLCLLAKRAAPGLVAVLGIVSYCTNEYRSANKTEDFG